MSVFGKLMDSMKINPDPEDDEYYGPEDDYGYEEEPVKSKGIFGFGKQKDEYIDEEDPDLKGGIFTKRNQNVSSARKTMEISMVKPVAIEDARTISNNLLEGKAVVLNLQGIQTDLAQRIIDFTSGSTYSINGKLQKISDCIFLATPANVDISGDFQELLDSGSFDVSGTTFRF